VLVASLSEHAMFAFLKALLLMFHRVEWIKIIIIIWQNQEMGGL
jgi:hypothetical protein